MKNFHRVMLTFGVIAVTGCSWVGIRDRSNDYLLAEETAPLVVPEDLDSNLGQVYSIPQIANDTVVLEDFELPRPRSVSHNSFEQTVKIQSYEGRRWVLINLSPSEAWPRLRSVLNRSGIPAERADGEAGEIDTVWVKFNSDEEHSHRFRFNVAPGVQLQSTEISLLQQQVVRGEEEGASWPEVSQDAQREQEMLQLVATELANSSNYSSVSLLAQKIGGESKVSLVTPEVSDPFIQIELSFDRSWASISYASERGGFTVIDKDRSAGTIYVNYSAPESSEEQGFFSRWFGGDDDKVEMNYQVLIQSAGKFIEVRIVDANGESLPRREAQQLLTILRSNMS